MTVSSMRWLYTLSSSFGPKTECCLHPTLEAFTGKNLKLVLSFFYSILSCSSFQKLKMAQSVYFMGLVFDLGVGLSTDNHMLLAMPLF